jgi:hypothetical protein
MNLELTKDQYKTLLKVMYCGEWMLNSYKTSHDKIYKETENLEQHIFSYSKEFRQEKWIEYDEELEKYFPTAKMEDDLHKYVDIFNLHQRRL